MDEEMDDTLKRLLDAEVAAQKLVDEALHERDRIVAKAREEARGAEQRFNARIPEIQEAFRGKAEERARQSIAELQRRFEERRAAMEDAARRAQDQALEAALSRFLGEQNG